MKNRITQKPKNPVLEPSRISSGKVQIGGRLSRGMNKRVQLSAVLTEFSKDQILEDALAVYYGVADEATLERQKAVLTRVNELKEGKVPFELPLTPINNNATLTRCSASGKLTLRMGS